MTRQRSDAPFHQVGIEYLGPNDALADAEVISAAHGFWPSLTFTALRVAFEFSW